MVGCAAGLGNVRLILIYKTNKEYIMHLKILVTIFTTIFIAELGDKTQFAAMLFAADKQVNKFGVFCAAALALLAATVVSVSVGGFVSQFVSREIILRIAGIAFIGIGIWTFCQAL
jgi:putative Ca2+/H+ antiporter (TMEM165/GDT1 family)